MKKLLLPVLLPLLALMLLSCAAGTPEPSKQELILGTWAGSFDGQDITLVYSAEEVTVEGFGISFPYEWVNEDEIKLDAMGQEVISRVEFPTPDQMQQSSDQGVQMMTRVE